WPGAQHGRLQGAGRRHGGHRHRRQGRAGKAARAGPERRVGNSAVPDGDDRLSAMMDEAPRGILLVISSPSGAGKTTLAHLLAQQEKLEFSVSYTTRPPRTGERDGVDYKFITEDEFTRMVDKNEFAEWAVVHGARYGTAIHTVNRALEDGKDYLFDIDWQGGEQIRRQWPDESVLVFILPPSMAELERRLRRRATDSPEAIERRLAMAN